MTEVAAPVAETPPAGAPPAPVPAATPPATPPAPAAPDDVASLPDWTQKMIKDLRTEAATNRTKATTAEQTRSETMDAIAKALGLKPDDDPAKAAATAAEERDAALAKVKATTVENSVLRMAAKHGANPEALTDSRSFMSALEALDPAADDFAGQVEKAIKTAIEANASLKVAPVVPARSGGPVGGGASVPGQLSADDIKGMTPAEIVKAKADGRLDNLLAQQAE